MVSRAVRWRMLLIAPSPSTTIRFSISCARSGTAIKAIHTLRLAARYRIVYIMADCQLGYKYATTHGGIVLMPPGDLLARALALWRRNLARPLLPQPPQLQDQVHDQPLNPVPNLAVTLVIHHNRVRDCPLPHGGATHRGYGEAAHV